MNTTDSAYHSTPGLRHNTCPDGDVPVSEEALPHRGRGRASQRSRTHHTYTVGEEEMPGKERSTTRGVAKKAARGSRWLASWCIPGTQCIQPVRVGASPSTSSQHSRGQFPVCSNCRRGDQPGTVSPLSACRYR